MLVLLAGLFVVHIATAIMLFVSTIANVSPIPIPPPPAFTHPREELWNKVKKNREVRVLNHGIENVSISREGKETKHILTDQGKK